MSHRFYNTITIEVRPLHEFPIVGRELVTESPMTGIKYAVKITKILELQWAGKGTVLVTLQGTKRALEVEKSE